MSAIAILTVGIEGRVSNRTTAQSDDVQVNEKTSTDLLIPTIVIGVLFVLILAAFIVLFVLYRRKQRHLTIVPDDKSGKYTY